MAQNRGSDNNSSNVGGIVGELLRSFVERIENLEESKRETAEAIKAVYAEAKGTGLDPKIIRLIVRERARDADDVAEEQALLDTYKRALGMLSDTPLGEAAVDRARQSRAGAPANTAARKLGRDDGWGGRPKSALYPSGAPGHGDYELGYAEGELSRAASRGGIRADVTIGPASAEAVAP